MAMVMTAHDVLERRRIPVTLNGRRGLSPAAMLRRLTDRGWARSTVNIIMQRIFVEGLVDADGDTVDPAETSLQAMQEEDGTVIVRMAVTDHAPVHLRCSTAGPVRITGRDGLEAETDEWRDLPDILPAFLVREDAWRTARPVGTDGPGGDDQRTQG